jgi:hypothetical protein
MSTTETSIFKGTLSRADIFNRHVLPKIENDIRGAVTRLHQELARLQATADGGATYRGKGITEQFTADEVKELAPNQFAELVTLKDAIGTIFKQNEIEVGKAPTPGPVGASLQIEPLTVQSGDEPPLKADEITATLPPPSSKKTKDAPVEPLS